jgi:hypothetical protein
MLETIAIAALVLGGVSTAAVVSDEHAVSEQNNKPVAVEVQQAPEQKAEAVKNPFLD